MAEMSEEQKKIDQKIRELFNPENIRASIEAGLSEESQAMLAAGKKMRAERAKVTRAFLDTQYTM